MNKKNFKKIIVTVVLAICLVCVLAGCTPKINIDNKQTGVVDTFQNAILNSSEAPSYYVKERTSLSATSQVEYIFNMHANDESIDGVDNTIGAFHIKTTNGVDIITDTLTFGPALPNNIKAKNAIASDYQFHAFTSIYNKAKPSRPIKSLTATTPQLVYNMQLKDVTLRNYTPSNILSNLKALSVDDMDFTIEKGGAYKKGYVSFYTFKVNDTANPFSAYHAVRVQVFQDKILQVAGLNEKFEDKYVIDITYQGPKVSVPSYDNYLNSGAAITMTSDRIDGKVMLFTNENYDIKNYILIDVDAEVKLADNFIDQSKTFTEVRYNNQSYFILTKNIVDNTMSSQTMTNLILGGIAGVALVLSILALAIMYKQHRKKKKALRALAIAEREAENAETEKAEAKKAETEHFVETTDAVSTVDEVADEITENSEESK